jgi:hypothetical protein
MPPIFLRVDSFIFQSFIRTLLTSTCVAASSTTRRRWAKTWALNAERLRIFPSPLHAARATMTTPSPDLLDDLCSRFILNVPPAELE